MSSDPRRTFVRRLLAWGRANRRAFPWREETDPFRVLVAEVLLQRSRGGTVARVYGELFARWTSASALASADVDQIRSVIRPLGLVRRAETLRRLAAAVVERGEVPSSVPALQELPGVGRYAAHATAAVAFGRGVPTVDGVSARVYRRYFDLPSDVPAAADERLWATVAEVTPRRAVREWNWAVLDLAATVCLPEVPRCPACPLFETCAVGSRLIVSEPGARLRRSAE
jgi:A/G-specific adenine glycosylase